MNGQSRRKRLARFTLMVYLLAAPLWAKPMTPVQVVDAREPGWRSPPTISSDGRRVAFCVMQPSRKQPMLDEEYYRSKSGVFAESVGNDVYLADLDGQVTNLTNGQGSSYAPTWSPDGRKLAFVSDRDGMARLWVWEDGQLRRLSGDVVWVGVGFDRPTWTQDSQSLIVKMLPRTLSVAEAARKELGKEALVLNEGDEVNRPVKVYDSRRPEAEKTLASRRAVAELHQVWLGQQPSRLLARGVFCCGGWVSPDSNFYAYTQYEGLQGPTSQLGLFRLKVVELQSGKLVAESPTFPSDFGCGVSWSPDSQSLAYFAKKSFNDYRHSDVFRMKITGQIEKVTQGPYFQETRGPLWQDNATIFLRSDSEILRCGLDGQTQSMAVPSRQWVIGEGDTPFFHRSKLRLLGPSGMIEVDWKGGSWKALPGSSSWNEAVSNRDGQTFFVHDISASGHFLGLYAEGIPKSLFVYNPQFEAKSLGRPVMLEYGQRKAAMLLPPDYVPEKRYPVVMVIYGGDNSSRYLQRFGLGYSAVDNYHLLASRGYIVVRPDLPIESNPVADISQGVDLAVDALIEQGYADPTRLAVMGHSYGGYSVLAVLTQSNRFAAAVARVGISNFVNEALRFDDGKASFQAYTETGQGKMQCTLWENRQRYIDNSPVFWLDRIQTPLLLVHGQKDNAAWVEETGQVFVGLRRLGKPVVYLAYPGEGHWEASWTRAHQLDYLERLLRFLEESGVAP